MLGVVSPYLGTFVGGLTRTIDESLAQTLGLPTARVASQWITPEVRDMMNAIGGAAPNVMTDPSTWTLASGPVPTAPSPSGGQSQTPSSVPQGDQTQSPDSTGQGD